MGSEMCIRDSDTCAKGAQRHGRRALIAFACSLNDPLMNRTAQVGQARVKKLIEQLGFNMPPANADGSGTPPSTAVVLGQVAASPRRVHHLAGIVLASLIGRGGTPLQPPTLIKRYDFTNLEDHAPDTAGKITPNSIIRTGARGLVRALLSAPLCYQAAGKPTGTLKDLGSWCASRHPGLKVHFAKTGTQVTEDVDATVDAWIAGGLQFTNGSAYSYVVVVGTGSTSEPWARSLHAAQVAVPLLEALLTDLEAGATGRARTPVRIKPKAPATSATTIKKQAKLTAN